MYRELNERFRVVANCPVKVYVASYIDRYWYPYRLQHAEKAKPWAMDESLELILDSAIGDNSVGNEETLDKADELNADFVIPADTLNDQTATSAAIEEFVEIYEGHPCSATPLIPLQPPYDQHYRQHDEFSHYCLGGIATAEPEKQLREIRKFRREAGRYVYAHGLGLGASLHTIKALRDDPTLLDSFDLSTPEQVIRGEKLPDKTWKQGTFRYPCGEDSSTIRAQFASAVTLQLNYMLGPFCDDEILDDAYQQSTLAEVET